MPCRCDYDDYVPPSNVLKNMNENNTIEKQKKTIENLRNELMKLGKTYNDLKGEADKVTQLLCYTCGTLIGKDIMSGLVDNRLIEWWKANNDWDKHRTLDMFKKHFLGAIPTSVQIRMLCISGSLSRQKWFIL